MIDDFHPERFGLLLQIPSNSSHTKHAEDFTLGVMAETGSRLAAPFPFAKGKHACVEVAQGADDQEHVDVSGGIVDGGWDVGYAHGGRAEAACVDIYLVVAGALDG